MTNRSANATIKGYFYQFDHTIVQLLNAATPQASVLVEGIEDIDLDDGDNSAYVQCKYYEGSEYNHSIIKDAVIQMLKHFHSVGCPSDQKFKYLIYGHYKEGQEKLPATFNLDFLKNNFLKHKTNKKVHEVHVELGVSDVQLASFQSLLNINLNAPSYDEQHKQIITLLVSQIPDCNSEDAKIFYYPNAINVIQALAIQAEVNKRTITKEIFVSEVNRKDAVFRLWLCQKFGNDYYAKLIKRKHFNFRSSTKIPKASRIFVIDMTDEFDLLKAAALLSKIGNTYSHVEHLRTPPQDRFCPYVLLRGLNPQDLVLLKESLFQQGIAFQDGYPFYGSLFSPSCLTVIPTKENLIRLKFIPTEEELTTVVSVITGSVVEIFDFYKVSPLETKHTPTGVSRHLIKVPSTFFINEVL